MSYDFDFHEMEQEIDEMTERLRQDRVDRGLPPEAPEPFVSMPISRILLERLAPLRDVILRYALLVNNAKTVLPLDVSVLLRKYEMDLNLLQESVGLLSSLSASLLRQSLEAIQKAQQDADFESGGEIAESLVRGLYINLELAGCGPSLSDINVDESAEDRAEYKRLISDEALIQSEIEKYSAEYESIRHLI